MDGKKQWDGPPLEAWGPWSPREAAERLDGCGAPWCVVGGWAIDLALGRVTREHEDLEIGVPRAAFPQVRRHLEGQGLILHEAGDEETCRLAPGQAPRPDRHQTWVEDPVEQLWRLDVMLEPTEPPIWRCRRHAAIRAPFDFMVAAEPIPHLKPHGVLLYKAKWTRPKDEADLKNAAPLLSAEERAWLIDALELAHPGHAWTERLRSGAP
jgi:aminoglycoside-2''-adenylyltransferase